MNKEIREILATKLNLEELTKVDNYIAELLHHLGEMHQMNLEYEKRMNNINDAVKSVDYLLK